MSVSEYWSKVLSGSVDVSLASEPVRHGTATPAVLCGELVLGERERADMPADGAARSAFFLAALNVLVYKHSGRVDPVLSVARVRGSGGELVPFRADVDATRRFREYVADVERARADNVACQETFEDGGAPRRIGFTSEDAPASLRPRIASLPTEAPGAKVGDAVTELHVDVRHAGGSVTTRIDYDANRFSGKAVQRLLDAFHRVLAQALSESDPAIREISLISADEERLVLGPFNASDTGFDARTFHGLFEVQAARVPESLAVVDEKGSLTYAQLNARANQLAHHLLAKGLRENDVVGVLVGRSLEAIVAMLGIMKAGGAYLPIEPGFPAQRIQYMLEDSRCAFVMTEAAWMAKVPASVEPIDVRADLSALSTANPGVGHVMSNLAYVIYTSGSTGEPKGVPIHHEGPANLHNIFRDRFAIDERDRMAEFASFSFDTSVWEIVMCILSGASLHILSDALKANSAKLEQYIVQHGITVATFPPTYLSYIERERVPGLRQVAVAGSECPAQLLKKWNEHVAFFNAYGPTEHSVCVAVFNAPKHRYDEDIVPIGRPLFNKRIYIVGPDRQLQPIGAPGELWVSGVGTSRGYIGQPALTREKFVANPFPVPEGPRAAKHAVAYRTGDLARWREDGALEFIGRVDNQVKVRGYRIELDEVDSALMRVRGIAQAGSVVKKDAGGANVLYGYYTTVTELGPGEVREALARSVPEFMIPSRLVRIDDMPLTNSDKVDRKALAARSDDEPVVAKGSDAPAAAGDEKVGTIGAIVVAVLGKPLPEDGLNTQLQNLGVDSLTFMKIVVGLEENFGTEFDDDFLLNGRSMTVVEIARLIDKTLGTPGEPAAATLESQ